MFDRIANAFSSSAVDDDSDPSHGSVPDLIEVLGLVEWYTALSDEEQRKLYEHSTMFSLTGESNQLDQSIRSTSQTQQGYLKGVGESAVRAKDYVFAEQVLLTALDVEDCTPEDRHFVYNTLITLYYKQRDEREDAIENCITYCKADIETLDEFESAWNDAYNDELPQIPAFKRLAIIYENQERYEEAREVCEMALERGLDDGTNGGFEGRKQRIESKLNA